MRKRKFRRSFKKRGSSWKRRTSRRKNYGAKRGGIRM